MINNVVLIGRLTKDADLKYTSNGTAVATFSLAVNRNYTNQSGEKEADFINCVVWRKPAETFCTYTKKGSMVAVQGRLQTRTYENQQGQRVYITEVIVESFQFLNTNNDKNINSVHDEQIEKNTSQYSNSKPSFNFNQGGVSSDLQTPFDEDNDVPF